MSRSVSTEAQSFWLHDALKRMRLVGMDATPPVTPLAGGVSSDIYRVDLASGPICVKRALPALKVAAQWNAPVERNRWEVEWIRTAGAIVPEFVPKVLGEDRTSGSFAMEYLDPGRYPVWKAELRDGVIDPAIAREVARRIVAVHAATAGDESIARRFRTDDIFHAIRLEPYLLATARAHPEVAKVLEALAETTARNKRALVHGDVSPKNILVGAQGPVLLDAECAWYGDPAFDLAFCLNHLLLKCLWRPANRDRYLEAFTALATAYLEGVTWESPDGIERRTARLLPGLFLGRVDGKSPVEYLTRDDEKDRVRRAARARLVAPVDTLEAVRDAWREELSP